MLRRTLLACGLVALLPCLVLAADKDPKKSDSKPTVVVFRLNGEIPESPPVADFSLSGDQPNLSLKELTARMRKAAQDPAVKAVILFTEGGVPGGAQKEELRQAIKQLQTAGKEVHAHADSLTMGEYILLSGANRLSVSPTGDLWVNGMHGEAMYLRGLLDMLGVKPDFLTCGDFKSASEIFMRDGPSPEAEKMQNWLLDSSYETYLKMIADGRKSTPDRAKAWIDGGPYTAKKAGELGLIDKVEHRQDFEANLKEKFGKDVVFEKKYGEKKAPQFDFSSPFAVFKILGDAMNEAKVKTSVKDGIAIVYVDGAIGLGSGSGGMSPFGGGGGAFSSDIRKALDEAARDEKIKAVVLRVDSPGGSATASEIILDATRRVKAKKPFVVSMGNVAGSGGYYVACASDIIYADESTITGSIGVVGGKLVTTPMWNRVGITFKEYARGANAGMLSSGHAFSKEEKARMQGWMDEIYGEFKGHVTKIRGKRLKKPIDEIAGGRVYTGRQALELGLVDRIGTLDDAVKFVAGEANLKDYDLRVVPEPKNIIEKLLEELAGGKDDTKNLKVGPSLAELALPHLKHLDPQRVAGVRKALQQLEMLQREGVLLVMPEGLIVR